MSDNLLRPLDDHEIVSLPAGWTWTNLGEIRLDNSQTIVPNNAPNQVFELYSVPAFERGRPDIVAGKEIGSNKQTIEKDTVILCKINPRINRVWIVGDFSPHPKIASTEWIPFFKVEIEPRYLCYYMQNSAFRDFLALRASGVGGSLMRIKSTTFSTYPFPLAPLYEQHRIVAKVEELFTKLDAGVKSLTTVKAQLKRYHQSVLKSAFEGKLTEGWRRTHRDVLEPASKLLKRIREERRKGTAGEYKEPPPLDTSNLPELPEGWTYGKLEDWIYIAGRIGWRGLKAEEYTREGPLLLSVYNLSHGKVVDLSHSYHISEERYDESPEIQLMNDDILLVKDGAGIGRVGIVQGLNAKATVNSSLLVVRSGEVLKPRFLFYLLQGPKMQEIVKKRITGSATPHLFQRDIKKFELLIPPPAEQQAIVKEIESRLSVMDQTERVVSLSIEQEKRLRQSILRRAFEGNLTLQDPSDEPAAVLLERIKLLKALPIQDRMTRNRRKRKDPKQRRLM